MQRDDMLAKVEAAYEARRSGDFAALEAIVSPEAKFCYGGEQSLLASVPASGAGGVMQAARELFERIEIRSLERVQAVAEAIASRSCGTRPSSRPEARRSTRRCSTCGSSTTMA